jgi:serine/threonine-protein kinase RsbT
MGSDVTSKFLGVVIRVRERDSVKSIGSVKSIRIEEPQNSGGGTTMRREVRVTIGSPADIVQARQQGRELAIQAGFSVCDSTLITTAISEMSRNLLEYAYQGEVTISLLKNGIKSGVKIVVSDQGPGIADISQVMQDGYSSRKGMGIGLPGTKRLMDEFEIRSKIGTGTTVTMKKWNRWKK